MTLRAGRLPVEWSAIRVSSAAEAATFQTSGNWRNSASLSRSQRWLARSQATRRLSTIARARRLNEQEIRTLWEKLDTAKMEPGCRTALRLILILGQRPGEVLGAEWSEIDLDTSWWVIPAAKAKSGIQHRVPLTALALEQLEG